MYPQQYANYSLHIYIYAGFGYWMFYFGKPSLPPEYLRMSTTKI